MEADLGEPIAYLVVPRGLPVVDPDGDEAGAVEQVLADERADIFHGLIIDGRPGGGPRHMFADADQVGALYERGALLAVDRARLYDLDAPMEPGGAGIDETKLRSRLQEARQWVSEHG